MRRKTKELWENNKGDGRQDCLRDLAAWGGAFAYQLLLAMEMVSDPFPLQAACLMLAEEPHGACTPGLWVFGGSHIRQGLSWLSEVLESMVGRKRQHLGRGVYIFVCNLQIVIPDEEIASIASKEIASGRKDLPEGPNWCAFVGGRWLIDGRKGKAAGQVRVRLGKVEQLPCLLSFPGQELVFHLGFVEPRENTQNCHPLF